MAPLRDWLESPDLDHLREGLARDLHAVGHEIREPTAAPTAAWVDGPD